jgi:ribosomal subunit interface protein
MQINITRKNAGLSDSLRTYVESKLEELESRYDKVIDAQVVMTEHGRENVVEISLHAAGRSFFAKDTSTNLRAAFDSCIDKLDRQLEKKKEKLRRKALTQQESIMAGKSIVTSDEDVELAGDLENPLLTFDTSEEDEYDEYEERTGT